MTKAAQGNKTTPPAAAAPAAAATTQTTQAPVGGDAPTTTVDATGGAGQPQAPPPAADTPAAPAAPPAAPAKPAAQHRERAFPPERNGRTDAAAIAMLLRICEVFGINPDLAAEEVLGWTYWPKNDAERTPAACTVVTFAGQKFKLFDDDTMDDDTVERLGRIFRIDPDPKTRVIDLPDDLTLPPNMVKPVPSSADHVYKGGYLRQGGASEANRRQAVKKKTAGK